MSEPAKARIATVEWGRLDRRPMAMSNIWSGKRYIRYIQDLPNIYSRYAKDMPKVGRGRLDLWSMAVSNIWSGGIHRAINAYYMIMLIKALTTNHAFYGWKMFIKCFDPLRCILSKVSHEKHLIHPTPSAPIILKHFNIVVCYEVVGLKKSNSKWKCINHTNSKLHANSQKTLFCLLV